MSLNIDRLAEQIATLDRAEQEALKKVAELTFQRGLATLARQYRSRFSARRGRCER